MTGTCLAVLCSCLADILHSRFIFQPRLLRDKLSHLDLKQVHCLLALVLGLAIERDPDLAADGNMLHAVVQDSAAPDNEQPPVVFKLILGAQAGVFIFS
mgnify:CR=1 FL=1